MLPSSTVFDQVTSRLGSEQLLRASASLFLGPSEHVRTSLRSVVEQKKYPCRQEQRSPFQAMYFKDLLS